VDRGQYVGPFLGQSWPSFEQGEEDVVSAQTSLRQARLGKVDLRFKGGGMLVRILNKVFQVVDRPWKMYPVGVLFGLGFDTSSEIAVIGIATVQGAQGTSIWLILIFPILFTGTSSVSTPRLVVTLLTNRQPECALLIPPTAL
jgi:high-affinity nickel permease